jgi:hypothetical protein
MATAFGPFVGCILGMMTGLPGGAVAGRRGAAFSTGFLFALLMTGWLFGPVTGSSYSMSSVVLAPQALAASALFGALVALTYVMPLPGGDAKGKGAGARAGPADDALPSSTMAGTSALEPAPSRASSFPFTMEDLQAAVISGRGPPQAAPSEPRPNLLRGLIAGLVASAVAAVCLFAFFSSREGVALGAYLLLGALIGWATAKGAGTTRGRAVPVLALALAFLSFLLSLYLLAFMPLILGSRPGPLMLIDRLASIDHAFFLSDTFRLLTWKDHILLAIFGAGALGGCLHEGDRGPGKAA